MTTFIACIATATDCGYCDVAVAEADEISYKVADDGTETPVYGMSARFVLDPTDTDVSTDDDDKFAKVQIAAAHVLDARDWKVVGGWEVADDALYATVERV